MDKIAETIFQQLSAKHSNAIAADVLNVAIVDFETMSDGTYKTDLIYKLPKVC